MKTNEDFLVMFKVLKLHSVYSTPQFRKDIENLVKTRKKEFIKDFLRDFSRIDLKDYKRYERLRLSPQQSKKIGGKSLFRYEYRSTSNLRCIYIIEDEYNKSAVLLNAFNEDAGKTKGKGSYNFNIERAIKTYLKNQ